MTLVLSIKLIRFIFLVGLAVLLLVPDAKAKKVGAVCAGIAAAILAFLVVTGKF